MMEIREVQNRLFCMAVVIRDILERNGIPYMLAYGTLLGAVRHQGFIPWDDDFDFYLFDDSYEDAMSVLRKELPATMFLEDETSEPMYFHGWAHVKDVNTIAVCETYPQDGAYKHKGLSIDLYRIKRVRECELYKYLNSENRAYVERRYKVGQFSEAEYRNRLLRIQEEENSLQESSNQSYVYGMVTINACKKLEETDIFPLKKRLFEGEEFLCPNRAEDVLTKIYGDYLKLPPIEKRVAHYTSVEFVAL